MSNNHVTSKSPPASTLIFSPCLTPLSISRLCHFMLHHMMFRLLYTLRCPKMSVATNRIRENNFVQCDVRQLLRTLKASAPLFRQKRQELEIISS